jgi:hypothetical protein
LIKNRFYALRALSVIYRVLGWAITGFSAITGLFFLFGKDFLLYDGVYYFMPEMENVRPLGIVILVLGLLIGLGIVSIGETMRVTLELEKNTRATTRALERLTTLQEKQDVISSSSYCRGSSGDEESDAPSMER